MGYASQLGTFSITIKKRFLSLALPVLIISLLSGICSVIIFGYLFMTPMKNRIINARKYDSLSYKRIEIYKSSINMIIDKP
ncbi:MAG: hypothetical protein ACFFDW_05775, partial [Candidatus Thorarchaeota archaeon]